MPPFNGRQLQQQLRAFLFFIQLKIMMYLLFVRRPQQPPQAAPPPPPPPARQRPRRRHNMWVTPWPLQREERGAYHNIMAELYATDIPGFTNYMRMTPEFFEMIKTRVEPRLARQATNYRAPISVGEKLALTIRYLVTGESYTSLSCQFRVGRPTISKFLPEVCRAIQDEFTREYLRCPTTPDEWKELEREFRIRWNVPHALGALDGKHVALKKPKNSGTLYHNYKGFFSIVMLALVDGQYKFRWVDAGTAGSCSDAQIFNACQLKRRIEDGRIGFPDPAPITQGGRDVPNYILADDALALKTWLMKPYGRRMLTSEESQLQNIKGQESCWECFWHPGLKIQSDVDYWITPRNSQGCGHDLYGSAQHTDKPVSRSTWWSRTWRWWRWWCAWWLLTDWWCCWWWSRQKPC